MYFFLFFVLVGIGNPFVPASGGQAGRQVLLLYFIYEIRQSRY